MLKLLDLPSLKQLLRFRFLNKSSSPEDIDSSEAGKDLMIALKRRQIEIVSGDDVYADDDGLSSLTSFSEQSFPLR